MVIVILFCNGCKWNKAESLNLNQENSNFSYDISATKSNHGAEHIYFVDNGVTSGLKNIRNEWILEGDYIGYTFENGNVLLGLHVPLTDYCYSFAIYNTTGVILFEQKEINQVLLNPCQLNNKIVVVEENIIEGNIKKQKIIGSNLFVINQNGEGKYRAEDVSIGSKLTVKCLDLNVVNLINADNQNELLFLDDKAMPVIKNYVCDQDSDVNLPNEEGYILAYSGMFDSKTEEVSVKIFKINIIMNEFQLLCEKSYDKKQEKLIKVSNNHIIRQNIDSDEIVVYTFDDVEVFRGTSEEAVKKNMMLAQLEDDGKQEEQYDRNGLKRVYESGTIYYVDQNGEKLIY